MSDRALDLRARTLIARRDPRIHRELRHLPTSEVLRNPDGAYFDAARLVAERDADAERTRRGRRRVFAAPAGRAAYLAVWATAAALVGGLLWVGLLAVR